MVLFADVLLRTARTHALDVQRTRNVVKSKADLIKMAAKNATPALAIVHLIRNA